MKPFASKLAGLFALLLLPCLAQADNMVTIYDAALDNDPVLGAARAGHKARKQAVPQARSQLLPNITAGASTTWNERSFPVPPIQDTNPASPTFGQFVDVPDQNFNEHAWQARLTQPLLDMEAWYGVGSAKATVKQSANLLAATEQNLIVRVIQSYLSVLRAGSAGFHRRRGSCRKTPARAGTATFRRGAGRHYRCAGSAGGLRQFRCPAHPGGW
ncbi:MAG: TolC family protein [Pseudomonadales bacterium]